MGFNCGKLNRLEMNHSFVNKDQKEHTRKGNNIMNKIFNIFFTLLCQIIPFLRFNEKLTPIMLVYKAKKLTKHSKSHRKIGDRTNENQFHVIHSHFSNKKFVG